MYSITATEIVTEVYNIKEATYTTQNKLGSFTTRTYYSRMSTD